MRHFFWDFSVAIMALGACSNSNNGFATDGGADALDSSMLDVNVGFPDVAQPDAPICTQCSADLHEVLTCGSNPQVVQTCTGNTGCGATGCIDACDAAAENKSSVGCDYYSFPSDGWNTVMGTDGTPGSCFAAFVTNNWSSDMSVTLVYKGTTINGNDHAFIPSGSGSSVTYTKVPSTGIPPNSMAIVFLNDYPGGGDSAFVEYTPCPAGTTAAVTTEDMVIHSTSVGHAIEIQTSVPAVVYDIYPFGGAHSYISSATLLLPTTSWDVNYVATTMSDDSTHPTDLNFVAMQDGTQITILPTDNITAGTGVVAATKGSPTTYNLNQGETIHFVQFANTAGYDLSGSIVQSNVPMGLWGGHVCEVQPNPPTWRIVGTVDGTTLKYDPANTMAPATLKEGQVVEFNGPGAFHVVSQDTNHPFYLAAHRPAGDCDSAHQQIPPIKALGNEYAAVGNESTNYDVGGPETVNVVPPAQFLPSYIFFTDPTYGYSEIAITRQKASDGTFHNVTVDCVGTVTGWQPIGTAGQYQYVHVDLATAGAGVGKCNNGLHTASSDTPFGITVWGYDSASSYAYPAGASVKPINTVVVPPTPH
jgi:IgGFc binding protein